MQTYFFYFLNRFGYFALFLLIALENIFPPIPSEIILPFSGFMTTYTKMNYMGTVFVSTAGSLLGAIILYYAGSRLSKERLEFLLNSRIGHCLHFKPEDVQRSIAWFHDKGNSTVFFCRCIPIIRSLISIPAGISHMNFKRFLLYTTLGSAIWNIILIGIGHFAGSSWQSIVSVLQTYLADFKHLLILAFFVLLIIFYFKQKKKPLH